MLADLVLKGRLPWIFTENERSLLAIDLDSTAAQRSANCTAKKQTTKKCHPPLMSKSK